MDKTFQLLCSPSEVYRAVGLSQPIELKVLFLSMDTPTEKWVYASTVATDLTLALLCAKILLDFNMKFTKTRHPICLVLSNYKDRLLEVSSTKTEITVVIESEMSEGHTAEQLFQELWEE